ncbi:carboxymuconolactone decarboxylase family protein [Aquabacterium sp. J223]|uniref:carboxymuconolactone decarboxylase family protein n=1 Tax=Aquabacterium sp. J223 TaxID=2898431 RepID=UPI0021ADDAF9|nr:carboxymuconolactone decarboxylase family protein [Aquabacterium sp. J223]UUX95018.1 carboxymuconolactone decarboxylase family protein [Aquabacterium sp. J223]
MPRLPLPTVDTFTPEQRAVHDQVVAGRRGRVVGPLRAALHNPELASRWQALGELLRYGTSLPPQLSELAILVTAVACRSPFEWHVHREEAERAGLPAAVIEALLDEREPPGLDEPAQAVHRYAVELNHHRTVSDTTHARARAVLGDKGVVELTALVGYYTLVAMTLNAHEIPLPDGAAPAFPLPQHVRGHPVCADGDVPEARP